MGFYFRYMVSKKEIRPGEVIIAEEPLIVGPCTDCKVQCLGCYKNLENEVQISRCDIFIHHLGSSNKCYFFHRCPNCQWPLCSRKCPGLKKAHGHTQIECTILQECKSASFFNYNNLEDLRLQFQTIGKPF